MVVERLTLKVFDTSVPYAQILIFAKTVKVQLIMLILSLKSRTSNKPLSKLSLLLETKKIILKLMVTKFLLM